MNYKTLPERFEENATRSDKPLIATIDEKGRIHKIGASEIKEKAGNFAVNLRREEKIEPGAKIGILSKPHLNWAPAILGSQLNRAVIRPITPLLSKKVTRNRIRRDKLNKVIVSPDQAYKVPEGLRILLPEVGKDPTVYNKKNKIREIKSEFKKTVDPDDITFLMPTSGTTGEPKLAELTFKNFDFVAHQTCRAMDVTQTDRVASVAPWDHIMGMTANLTLALIKHISLIYITPSEKTLMGLPSLIKENGVSIFLGLPKLFNVLYRKINNMLEESRIKRNLMKGKAGRRIIQMMLKREFGSDFRFLASGSAPEDEKTTRFLEKIGIKVEVGYGSTETTAINTVRKTDNWIPGSIGHPLPGVDARIMPAEELQTKNKKEIGELLISGPCVMKGYYNNPEATKEVMVTIDGKRYYRTGDLVERERGQIIFRDRVDNIIVLESGENVNPQEIEKVLGRLPSIKEILIKEGERNERKVIEAHIFPDIDKIRGVGVINSHEGDFSERDLIEIKKVIWGGIKRVQKELTPFQRIKSRKDITIKREKFDKTSSEKIKRK